MIEPTDDFREDYNTQCFVWEFRCNIDLYKDEFELIDFLKQICKKYVFQFEMGDTGYEHIQGRLSLVKKRRKPELMKLMEGIGMSVPNYLRPTVKKEYKNIAFYVMKTDTRLKGPWQDDDPKIFVPEHLKNLELYEWQDNFLKYIKDKNRRNIHCIIDPDGNKGKSTLCRYCMINYRGYLLPNINDGNKLIEAFCNMLMSKEDNNPEYLFIDFPKSTPKKLEEFFTCIEKITDGYVYDTRNVYKEWWFNPPKIIVMSNHDLNIEYLSQDRWCMYNFFGKYIRHDNKLLQNEGD